MSLWAWTYNPFDIPKVTWTTITGQCVCIMALLDLTAGGLTFCVIVHLELLEMSPDSHGRSSQGTSPRAMESSMANACSAKATIRHF
jgi:hypothetical protein